MVWYGYLTLRDVKLVIGMGFGWREVMKQGNYSDYNCQKDDIVSGFVLFAHQHSPY